MFPKCATADCVMCLAGQHTGAGARTAAAGQGARVLCPVPLVTGGLVEPPVVPKFLQALEVLSRVQPSIEHADVFHGVCGFTTGHAMHIYTSLRL